MKRLLTILASLALAGGVLAGCGGDDEEGNVPETTTTPPTQTTGTSGSAQAGGGEVTVSMKDIKYIPETVNATVGQTIKWTNDDPVAHTVTARSGADFDSGTVDAGGEYKYKVAKAGTIAYVCTIHPNQKGQIVAK